MYPSKYLIDFVDEWTIKLFDDKPETESLFQCFHSEMHTFQVHFT